MNSSESVLPDTLSVQQNRSFLLIFLIHVLSNLCIAEEELWIQQWGLASANGVYDYDPAAGHLLTRHQASAVLWDVKTGLALRHYPYDTTSFFARFLPDDRLLLKASEKVRLLNKQCGNIIRDIDLVKFKHSNDSNILLFNDGQPIFVASCGPETIRVWNLETGETLNEFPTEGEIRAADISPDQNFLLAGAGHIGILWDLETGKVQQRVSSPVYINAVEFNDDGSLFLTRGSGEFWYSPRVTVWETATGLPKLLIPRTVIGASFHNDQILLHYPRGEVELWSLDRHEKPSPKEDWPTYQSFRYKRWWGTQNHWRLHSDSEHGVLNLRGPLPDAEAFEIPVEPALLDAAVHLPLAFSPSGRWLLTGRSNWGIHGEPGAIWDLEQGRLKHHLEGVSFGTFHPTEDKVLLCFNELELMDLASGEILQIFAKKEEDSFFDGAFTSAQFSQDGKRVLVSTGDWYDGNGGGILIWNLETGEIERDYATSRKAVIYAGWNSDESKIVAALTRGDDGSAGINEIRVIDAQSGELLQTRMFPGSGISVGGVDPTGSLISALQYNWLNDESTANGSTRQNTTSLLSIDDLEQSKADLPGQPPFLLIDGSVAGYFPEPGKLSFLDLKTNETLHSRATSLRESWVPLTHPERSAHPGQLLVAGPLRNPRQPFDVVSTSVGLEHLLTGKMEAELFLFYGSKDWLIKNKAGFVNGSPGGLDRVTSRVVETLQVRISAEFTTSINDPQKVSEALTQSLPTGQDLKKELQKQPQRDIPQLAPKPVSKPQRYYQDTKQRKETAEKLKASGAEIKESQFRGVTYIHLEGHSVSDDLVKELSSAGGVDRLYLADTGITDQQLDHVGLLWKVKRMSLWGNPITDAGLAELSAMWSLEVLDIHDTQVTAKGINQLRSLPRLKTLIVPSSIEQDELQPLQNQFPELEIILRSQQ